MHRYIANYAIRLVREGSHISDRKIIRKSDDAFNIMKDVFATFVNEHFYIIMLNTKHHVLGISKICEGSLNASIVHPREVFQIVLAKGMVASIILAHNHPSGDPSPSTEDITLTKTLVDAGKLLNIPILDHIIIGDGIYISLKEKGVI